VRLPKIAPIKKNTKFRQFGRPDLNRRPIVLSSLGCHVDGAANPHPDPNDTDTMIAGVRKRFAFAPPEPDPHLLLGLKKFVRKWVETNMVPLPPDTDISVETWLQKTNYPLHRKVELKDKWESIQDSWEMEERYYRCKSFMKDETYPEYKHARGINSRTDEFKCRVGPIFRCIEEQLYKHPEFIKHVPVKDRPDYIYNMLFENGATYAATDYTAFESLFTKELMESCEFVLYEYMVSKMPDGAAFMRLLRHTLAGRNRCVFRDFVVSLDATRMSGEMNTSLGNGFSNLMIMLYMCQVIGSTNVVGVVEGDDGLFRCNGRFPTADEFARLGLVIKIELHRDISSASFCGIIFSADDRVNITDPIDALLEFGWTTNRYAASNSKKLKLLLRCKALSLAFQYPGCPIVSALAEYGLRMTRSFQVSGFIRENRGISMWEREQLLAADQWFRTYGRAPIRPVGADSRELMHAKYGIDPVDQLAIEQYLGGLTELQPLQADCINRHIRSASFDYFEKYSQEYMINNGTGHGSFNYPDASFCMIKGYDKEW
jgi:hypothetical protein